MEEQGIVKYFKRKSRTSSSGSDKTPPKKNKQKEDLSLVYSETDESTLVDEALDMAQSLGNKLDQVLSKLDTLETRVAKIHNDVSEINKRITEEVNRLDGKIAQLEEGANYVTNDVNDLKMNLYTANKKASKEVEQLKLELLNMNVYQRRENLRFYGIKETDSPESGNTEVILKDFISDVLNAEDAWGIKFQRVHRVGKPIHGKPRPIIARFQSYPDREKIMALRKSLDRGSGYGIGPDYPSEVVKMRKQLIPKLIQARKDGKRAFFSRPEPYKLIIEGQEIKA